MLDEAVSPDGAACPGCRAPLRPGARYCRACGYALTISAIPAAPAASTESPSMRAKVALHWGEIKRVAWLFGLLLGSSLALGTIARFEPSPWVEVVVSGIDALIVVGFVIARRREVAPLLGLPRLHGTSLSRLLVTALGVGVALDVYFDVMQRAGVPMLRYTDDYVKAGWPVWSMFVLVSVMPAVFEELAFRGVIATSLAAVLTPLEAWLIQAALFSVMHLMPIVFPSHFAMGLLLGWVRLRTASLYPGMLLHGLWNALVLAQELYP